MTPASRFAFAPSALFRSARSFCLSSTSHPRTLSSTYSPFLSATRRSVFHRARSLSTQSKMVASTDAPGILDTDDLGGVLMYPREGKLDVKCGPALDKYEGDLLALGVWAPEDDDAEFELPPAVKEFAESLGSSVGLAEILEELVTDAEFKAKSGSSTDVVRLACCKIRRVALYGLGKKSDGNSSVSGAAKFVVSKGTSLKSCTSVALWIDGASTADVSVASEGGITASFVDERYKEKKESEKVPTELLLLDITENEDTTSAIRKGHALAMGVITCKECVNAPANTLTPATLAAASEMVAKECGLELKIMGRDECQELGMGCYLGVGRGSTDEPKFIHMTYKPEGVVKKKICLVGKAVTFDTGGTNLKIGGMIALMKFDMGGSAAVLGSAKAIGEMKPPGVEVHFIMPAVENMIGDRAIHPGDVLKASNGKTVEVLNTDAEGRLCLADALVYAENLGDVDYVIDIATLTGANMVALGNKYAGVWSSSDDLAKDLMNIGEDVGERMWQMPLVKEYAEGLKSEIADLRNIGKDRFGGAITASLFLKEFVANKNWAHIDMAGPVWDTKKGGATGFGVKSLTKFVERHAE